MTLFVAPQAPICSGPDGRSVADDLAREVESFGESPATQVDLSQLVEGDHEAETRPGRTTQPRRSVAAPSRPGDGHTTLLFRRLAKEIGVPYSPRPRAQVRDAVRVETDCRTCKSNTDLLYTDESSGYRRLWFRCQRCRRWWAVTITFRNMTHGPHEVPNRLKDNA